MNQQLTDPTTELHCIHCTNCGTPLQGVFCHACGQSIHSVLKPVHGMMEDALDLVLNVDGRVVHTLPPLFMRPGLLTLEYFAGRRMRYLAPFRLMFVLCLLSLFVLQLAMDSGALRFNPTVTVHNSGFKRAKTPADVDRLLQKQLAQLAPTGQIPMLGSLVGHQLDEERLQLVREAMQRRVELGDKTAVVPAKVEDLPALLPKPASNPPPPTELQQRDPFDSYWNMQKYPIHVGWLPGFLNQRLNRTVQHVHENLDALDEDGGNSATAWERLVGQLFSILPMTMVLMLPLFALLLKMVYLFRRRLYMEHLIVALHSHAFLFLSLLLGTLLYLLKGALAPHMGWINVPVGLLLAALWTWAPVYLLIMQKRVYRQGWFLTGLKYLFVGWCYCWLLGLALLAAFAVGLAS
ncbi:hypothetical protein B0E48_01435 [Rhodanobacter sp. C03]|nr:hypothetical protein B0E48_01435 [Rhodanobacter sp. C03]